MMSARRRFIAAGLALSAAALMRSARAAAITALRPESLAGIPVRLQSFVDAGTIAGAVYHVQQQGAIIASGAVGWRDLGSRSPMHSDTLFQVMSQSKPFIATAILMLEDERRLNVEDPVDRYLPEFADPWLLSAGDASERQLRRPSRKITIADVLSHCSGLPDAAPVTRAFAVKMRMSLAEVVGLLSQQPLEAEPGVRWRYSNQGIAVAARIVEVVAGMPFERYVEERIFAPLGMAQSSYRPAPESWPRLASCYELVDGRLREMGPASPGGGDLKYRRNTRYPLPEAGIFSTAADMARFHQLIVNGGRWGGATILSPRAMDSLLEPRIAIPAGNGSPAGLQALGWRVQPALPPSARRSLPLGAGAIHHGGAFGSFGWVDRANELVGIFLVQRPNALAERDAFVAAVDSALTH